MSLMDPSGANSQFLFRKPRVSKAWLLAVLLSSLLINQQPAFSQLMSPQGPDTPPPAAFLNVIGQGLAPNEIVTLSTGPQQQLSARVAGNGTVAFNNLKYAPTSNLIFALSFKVPGTTVRPIANNILIDLDPYTGSVDVKGNATRAASVILNVSSEDSKAMVANQNGYFSGSADSITGISDGGLKVVASIINVEEKCCPRSLRPFVPATFTISGQPVKKAESGLIEGSVTFSSVQQLPVITSGVSVPADLINGSWVTGLYNFANRVVENLMTQSASLGGFLDAQNSINARRSLQEQAAKAANNYSVGEPLCRFGSLSQSLVASDSRTRANRLSLTRALSSREGGTKDMLGASGDPQQNQIDNYTNVYCDPDDNNGAFSGACKNKAKDDRFNRDIDYTRVVDAPLTLDVDFTNAASTSDEEDVIALSENLFPAQPLKKTFENPDYLKSSGIYRSLQAIRSVAKNSFVSLISEKSKGTAGSSAFITALMKSLGVEDSQAQALMGSNPSYFAQMEVLTKKLYQDPSFYVNLIDTPVNVERQRASIRAIKLQQQNDFAQSVKRREMMLALLLELKLRERANIVNKNLANPSSE